MDISFRIADSAKSVLGSTEGPKAAWGSPREMRRCEAARAAICPHDRASDYQVGWKWYYPHSPRLYGQPSCRDNRCWHDNQRPTLLRTLHKLTPTPLLPRPSTCSLPFTKTLPTTSTSVTNSPSMRCGISSQSWWLARPTRQRMICSPYSVSKHHIRHSRRKGKGERTTATLPAMYGCSKKGYTQRKCLDGEKKW